MQVSKKKANMRQDKVNRKLIFYYVLSIYCWYKCFLEEAVKNKISKVDRCTCKFKAHLFNERKNYSCRNDFFAEKNHMINNTEITEHQILMYIQILPDLMNKIVKMGSFFLFYVFFHRNFKIIKYLYTWRINPAIYKGLLDYIFWTNRLLN